MAKAPKPPKAPKALARALCSMSFITILASAVKVAEERLREDTSLGQITSLPVENIIHLLSSCLKRTQFAYNSAYMVMEDVELLRFVILFFLSILSVLIKPYFGNRIID